MRYLGRARFWLWAGASVLLTVGGLVGAFLALALGWIGWAEAVVSVPLIVLAVGFGVGILNDRADPRELRRLVFVVAGVFALMAFTSYAIELAAIDSVDCTQPNADVSCTDDLGAGMRLFFALITSALIALIFWAGAHLGSARRRRLRAPNPP